MYCSILKFKNLFCMSVYVLAPHLGSIYHMRWKNRMMYTGKRLALVNMPFALVSFLMSYYTVSVVNMESTCIPRYFIELDGNILCPLILILKLYVRTWPGLWNMINSVLAQLREILLARSQLYKNLRSKFSCFCILCGDLEMLRRLVSSAKW